MKIESSELRKTSWNNVYGNVKGASSIAKTAIKAGAVFTCMNLVAAADTAQSNKNISEFQAQFQLIISLAVASTPFFIFFYRRTQTLERRIKVLEQTTHQLTTKLGKQEDRIELLEDQVKALEGDLALYNQNMINKMERVEKEIYEEFACCLTTKITASFVIASKTFELTPCAVAATIAAAAVVIRKISPVPNIIGNFIKMLANAYIEYDKKETENTYQPLATFLAVLPNKDHWIHYMAIGLTKGYSQDNALQNPLSRRERALALTNDFFPCLQREIVSKKNGSCSII